MNCSQAIALAGNLADEDQAASIEGRAFLPTQSDNDTDLWIVQVIELIPQRVTQIWLNPTTSITL